MSLLRRVRRSVWLVAAVVLGGAAGAETEPGAPGGLALGVAPFEVDAPPGSAVPDVAALLATRLATRGVQRVVGPAQLGAVPDADAEPALVRGWAAEAQVDAVVVGRTTRIGSQLSVDVWLRAGDTGEVARTLIEQFQRSEDLEGGLDHLAEEVVAATERLFEARAPEPGVAMRGPADSAGDEPEASAGDELAASAGDEPAASAGDDSADSAGEDPADSAGGGPAASAGEGPAVSDAGGAGGEGRVPFSFDFGGGDEPLAIESDELEVVQKDGQRRLVFSKNVRVRQGSLQLTSAVLEAVYPNSGGKPSHLTAQGEVRLAQGEQAARCDRLDYDRLKERLVCRGEAWFQDGENRLSGEVIEIDLRGEKVTVKGGANLLIQPEAKAQEGRTS